jgi:hypothetical protein
MGLPLLANENEPSLELLIFLAEFSDEAGDWDGPPMNDEVVSEQQGGEQDE